MLLILIALNSLWQVWRVRRRQQLARRYLAELAELRFGDSGHSAELTVPFWRAVLLRFRNNVSAADVRRARSRKAMRRLSRMASARF